MKANRFDVGVSSFNERDPQLVGVLDSVSGSPIHPVLASGMNRKDRKNWMGQVASTMGLRSSKKWR